MATTTSKSSTKKSEASKDTSKTSKKAPAASKKEAPQAKPSSQKPQTMEELLSQTGYDIVAPKKGDSVEGTITKIDKKALHLDLGAKTEGIVSGKEFDLAQSYIEDLKVGDKLEAAVVSEENDQGQIVLSLKRAAIDSKWDHFQELLDSQKTISVKGIDVNKGGLIAVYRGVRGFVPSSQFGKEFMGKFQKLKGKNVDVKIIEVDQEKNRLIFSERHVSEASEIAQREEALKSVESNTIYSGTVSGVMPFGLFVMVEVPVKDGKKEEVGLVEGLVHISEISWEKVEHPKDYHAVGDRIDVKVLDIDENTNKLNLSIKRLEDDPWTTIADRYPVGTTFTGNVTRVEAFGVFMNAEPGIDGLMHASKIQGEKFNVGDEVAVSVESVDPDQRRMSLSPVLTEVPVNYK